MLAQFEKTERGVVVILPSEFATCPLFDTGNTVNISLANGELVMAHPDTLHYTIEELLEGMTEENLHPEISTGRLVGNEVW